RRPHQPAFPSDASSSVPSAPLWSLCRSREPTKAPSGASPGRSSEVLSFDPTDAADFLARNVAASNADVPQIQGPATRTDAYRVQDALVEKLGGRCGWKVGRGGSGVEPYCAPLPAAWKLNDGQAYRPASGTAQLEAEIGFRLRSD